MSIATEAKQQLVEYDGHSQPNCKSIMSTTTSSDNLAINSEETLFVLDLSNRKTTEPKDISYENTKSLCVENNRQTTEKQQIVENDNPKKDKSLQETCNGLNGALDVCDQTMEQIDIKVEVIDDRGNDDGEEDCGVNPMEVVCEVQQKQKCAGYLLSDDIQKPLYRGAEPDAEKRIPTCPACKKTFASRANLFRHMPIHSRILQECKICYKTFSSEEHLEKHQQTQHIVRKYACEKCEKVFNSKSNLYQHSKIHLDVMPYNCDICQLGFGVNGQYQKHLAKNQCLPPEERINKCQVCKKVCKSVCMLRSHMKRHSEDRPYLCDQCEMCFKYKSALGRHLQLHYNFRPFICDYCGKTFTVKGLLVPHLRVHTGEKPYACPACPKMFRHQANLKRHVETHSRPKRLTCDLCHKTFPRPSRLKYHMRSHSKEKPFGCADCGQEFSHKQNVVRHYDRKHPGMKMRFKALGYSDALFNGEFTVQNNWSEQDRRIIEAIQAKGNELIANVNQNKFNDNHINIKQEINEDDDDEAKEKKYKPKKRRKLRVFRKHKSCKELKTEIKKKKKEFMDVFDMDAQNFSESEDEKTLFQIKMEVKSHEVFVSDIKIEPIDDDFIDINDDQEVINDTNDETKLNGIPFEIDFGEIQKSSVDKSSVGSD